ncbi:MAG: hypothetical protein KIT31_02255 [Deltaproteobacteria bacterium]|nr:hypothetical protein [Deltaproteobacteria bacterium]
MMGFRDSYCVAISIVMLACRHAPPSGPSNGPTTVAAGAPPVELRVPALDAHRGPRFLADRIYIFGRSETRIAYLVEPADEACGCYFAQIIVKDLVTGEVIWKDSYDSGELSPSNTTQLKNLDQLWRARGADWEKHLAEHGIRREPTIVELETLPTDGTSAPRFEIHTDEVDDQSPEGYAHVTSYRVDLVTADQTTTIARSTSPDPRLLHVDIPGYMAARNHGPAAVLLHQRVRGWEGPPSVSRLDVVGAHIPPRSLLDRRSGTLGD